MKKLLLILLCLPMIGFGQMGIIEHTYYYPHQDNGIYGDAKFDGIINHIIDLNYGPSFMPDSVYADGTGGTGLFAYGSINYNPNNLLSNWFDDIGPGLVTYTTNLDYNAAYKVIKADCYAVSIFGNEGTKDSLFYNSNNQLITKKRFNYFGLSLDYVKHFSYNTTTGKLTNMNYVSNTNIIYQMDTLIYNTAGQMTHIQINDGRDYEYHYNSSNNFCTEILLSFNGIFVDTVANYNYNSSNQLESYNFKEYDFTNSIPIPISDDGYDNETYMFFYDSFGRLEQEHWLQTDGSLGHILYYYYNSNPSSIIENYKSNKELLKVTDLLGRETKGTKNEVLFYIYDDGTVEKRIIIE